MSRTSSQIRQDFLDFFKSKQHTIVPSSSLMPDSPNLLFTNAGMNQFVPIFLGQTKCPYTPGRAADTQKCIRAGGKHNDLDDVGLDTYHHTFFEMLGNWSFGDYFKKEAIGWAWELVIEVWKFPPQRVYATIYNPDRTKGDPAERDEEAWGLWAEKFRSVGLDPEIHIVNGNKKDNFWMMGETGPCGPCTEVHVDLRPGPRETDLETQQSGRALVNGSDARCIEIWNNVFIQYNANPDGTFTPLPAQHVDTGMGFERVTSIIQATKGLTDFQNAKISNYETDIFRPIFDEIEKLSGKKYGSTLPKAGSTGDTEQEKIDVAFRVIADHIRTLSFSIADGIEPGAKERNGVLRSIHKRMVRYASTIDVDGDILLRTQDALVEILAITMGDVFSEVRARKEHIKAVLRREADVFNKTLGNGTHIFEAAVRATKAIEDFLKSVPSRLSVLRQELDSIVDVFPVSGESLERAHAGFLSKIDFGPGVEGWPRDPVSNALMSKWSLNSWQKICGPAAASYEKLGMLGNKPIEFEAQRLQIRQEMSVIEKQSMSVVEARNILPENIAFELHDTYGFPLDLTELMARERGLTVDREGFDKLMNEQRERGRASRQTTVISALDFTLDVQTKFVGYEILSVANTTIVQLIKDEDKPFAVVEDSPFYAEMGGQVGDTGLLLTQFEEIRVVSCKKIQNAFALQLEKEPKGILNYPYDNASLKVDVIRRNAIQRHHTVTHLLHWALHEVASKEASQKGSFVGPDKLTFDFNSAPLTPQQVADVEKLVNERILENAGVSWTEVAHADVKSRKDVMQFFGDKYGDTVRVVQIGGHAAKLDGYSMELCGGTHTRATGEIGLFRIVAESAVAAGVRRIEAVAGLEAYRKANDELHLIKTIAGKINSPIGELEKKIEAMVTHQKELEKQLKAAQQKEAAGMAKSLVARAVTVNDIPSLIENLGSADGDTLQTIADSLKSQFKGVIVLGGVSNGAVTLIAAVSPEFTAKVQAGKIIQTIAPIVGGKGGGKPDNARGGGKDASKLDEALVKAKSLLG